MRPMWIARMFADFACLASTVGDASASTPRRTVAAGGSAGACVRRSIAAWRNSKCEMANASHMSCESAR
jgi:hypothetical protein